MEDECLKYATFPCDGDMPEWFRGRRVMIDMTQTSHQPTEGTCEKMIRWMREHSSENGTHRKSFYPFVATYIVDDYMLYLEVKGKKR